MREDSPYGTLPNSAVAADREPGRTLSAAKIDRCRLEEEGVEHRWTTGGWKESELLMPPRANTVRSINCVGNILGLRQGMLAANNGVGLPVKGLDVQNSGFPSSFLVFAARERMIDWR